MFPLLGDVDDTGLHDLPFHRHEIVVPQVRIEGGKQLLHDAGIDEIFPKTPDSGGLRNLLTDVQTKKAAKGVPVKNLKLGRVIRFPFDDSSGPQRIQNGILWPHHAGTNPEIIGVSP